MGPHNGGRRRRPTQLAVCRPPLFAVALFSGVLGACGGDGSGSGSAPAAPVTVTVSGGGGTVQPGAAIPLTGAVANDSQNRGVTWSVTCSAAPCGSLSPTSTASGVATTYTAPAARPPADLIVTITATSAFDASAHGSASVTVAGGMAVTISSTSDNLLQVLAGTTKDYIATVDNDTAKAGVNWTLSCATPPCGTVTARTTASGVATTYIPPPLASGMQLDVTLTATAVSDSAISSSLGLTAYGPFILLDIPQSTVGAGAVLQISAEVYTDPANQDAAWTLQCPASDCGSLSASISASKAPIIYSAPLGPVPADLNVTITASSVSHPEFQTSATLTVAAVIVTVTPDSALMPLNATQQFTGSLQWAATDGIPWQLSVAGVACGSPCGKLSVGKTVSGESVTYTAPGIMPSGRTVSLVASAAADSTRTAFATIQLTAGTVKLVPSQLQLHSSGTNIGPSHKCRKGKQTATLTNTGAAPLAIDGITLSGPNPTAFSQTNTCLSPLGAGQSCDITATVNCSRSVSAVILIADSSVDSPQKLILSGNAAAAAVSASVRKALATQDAVATPAPTGRQVVGTRLASFIDADYLDPYLPTGSARELMVRFWYPAALAEPCTRADYTSPEVWSYFGTLLGTSLPQVSTHSCLDARVAAGAHPVVVLTHGFTGTFTDYTYLAEDLASRGYVVASVNHTYEATATKLSDGRMEKSLYGSYLSGYSRYDVDSLAKAVSVRLRDLTFVLSKLAALNQAPEGPFLGRLDLNRLALVGHSLGGLTTLQVLALEPRFKAGIILDGAVMPGPTPAVRQPVLALLAGDGHVDRDECRMWSAVQTPLQVVRLPGVEHIALSDAVWLAGTAVTTGARDPAWVIADARRSVAAFLDATFQGAGAQDTTREIKRSIPNALVVGGVKPGCGLR